MTEWSQPDPPDEHETISSAYGPPSTSPGYGPGTDRNAAGAPADWWRRVVAFILDVLILTIPNGIVGGLLGIKPANVDPTTNATTVRMGDLAVLTLVSIVISCIYSGILEGGRHGATVGKMALNIQVRDADTGSPLGFGRAAYRRLIYHALFLPILPGFINGLSPLWDARHQAWHDKAANSLVVNSLRK